MSDPRYRELYERDEKRRNSAGAINGIFAAIVGLLMPVRYSGKLYLVRELQRQGVDTSRFTEACLQQLTDEIILGCKVQAEFERYDWRAAIPTNTEQVAVLISSRVCGDTLYMSAVKWPIPYELILDRHGLLPFGLAGRERPT